MSRLRDTIQLRLGRQTKGAIKLAAELENTNTSQFIREAAYARAVVVLLQHQDSWANIVQVMVVLARRTHDPEVVRLTNMLSEEAAKFEAAKLAA